MAAAKQMLEGAQHASGDYTVEKDVLEDAKRRWGLLTIDAFASEATAVLPRYWTEQPSANSEGVDALRQQWAAGELIWAHPPTDKLAALVKHLKAPERASEVIVCAPYWKSAPWFLDLVAIADEKVKYRAGKLSRVAPDAPDRLEGWPLMIFHVPGRRASRSPASEGKGAAAEAAEDEKAEDEEQEDEEEGADEPEVEQDAREGSDNEAVCSRQAVPSWGAESGEMATAHDARSRRVRSHVTSVVRCDYVLNVY